MRHIAIIALAAAGLTMTACSRDTNEDIKQDVQQAGEEIKDGAQDVLNDPDVKEAGAAIKDTAKEAGAAVKDAAGDLGEAVREAKDDNDADPAE